MHTGMPTADATKWRKDAVAGLLSFTPVSPISAPQNLIENVNRDRVDLLSGHHAARSRDLLVRVPEQPGCERDARVALYERRNGAPIDVRRILVDLRAELDQRVAEVVVNVRNSCS